MSTRAIGWDIHRKFSKLSVRELSEDGELRVIERVRLEHNDREGMSAWLERQPDGTPVAMEAAFGWPWIADLVEAHRLRPLLGHPPAIRALAKHQAKTDRCDADRLAEFHLMGILPESYLAPVEVREHRDWIRYRMGLSKIRTNVKNRIQAFLHRHGVLHSFSDLFGVQGRRFLAALELPRNTEQCLQGYLKLLDQIVEQIKDVQNWLKRELPKDPTVELLMTIPGIGLVLGNVIRAEIGEIERFPKVRLLCTYAGLAPMSNDSAARFGRRHCSVACNRTLRWAFVEAANAIAAKGAKKAPRLIKLYQRVAKKGDSKNRAKVAVAREIAKLVYIIWKKQEPYTSKPPLRPGCGSSRQKGKS